MPLRGLEHVQVFDLMHFTDARESRFYDLRSPAVGNVNDTYAADVAPLGYYRSLLRGLVVAMGLLPMCEAC